MNKKRTTCLLNASEITQACSRFTILNLPVKINVYEGHIKVIESIDYDINSDFDKTIGKFLSYD